jgi:hypothetical protein
LANPEKNFVPFSGVLIATNSSKDAPAQKALSPALFNTITFMLSSSPALVIVEANAPNI